MKKYINPEMRINESTEDVIMSSNQEYGAEIDNDTFWN